MGAAMKRVRAVSLSLAALVTLVLMLALGTMACQQMPTESGQVSSQDLDVDRSAAETSAAYAGGQLTVQAALYRVTVEAQQAQADRERRTLAATQTAAQALQASESERRSLLATEAAQATERALRATEAAAQLAATERAGQATAQAQATDRVIQATATERAYQATVMAQATESSLRVTERAVAGIETRTAAEATGTRQSAMATATRRAEERDESMASLRDYGIPLVLLALAGGIIAAIIIGARWIAKRPVVYPRNLLGDADPLAFPQNDGGYALLDIDRQPGPVIRVSPDGKVEAPLLRNAGQEERTTARDQAVDGMSRPRFGGASNKSDTQTMLPMSPPPTPQIPGLRSIRVLRRGDQAVRAGALPPAQWEAIQADWEAGAGDE